MPKPTTKQIAGRRIFISYSHADYKEAVRLNMELEAMCRRLGDTAVFLDSKGDNQLMAGDPWRAKIRAALEEATVFLVLMSSDFIASPFCRDIELRRMLERSARERDVRVIGIALHEVTLENFWVEVDGQRLSLEERQCIPQDLVGVPRRLGLKPISSWRSDRRRDAWTRVAEQIEQALTGTERPMYGLAKADACPPAVPPSPAIMANWLPYLCDRDDQFYALVERLGDWQRTAFRRPFVALTEGRPEDCLAKWVERMRLKEIAACLGFDEAGLSFGHFKPVSWPSPAIRLKSREEAKQRFVHALGAAMGPRPLATPAEIFDAHLRRGRPALLWVDCEDRSDGAHARLALEGLLAALADCPDLNQHSLLAVAINLIRDAGAPPGEHARLAASFEAGLAAAEGISAAVLGSLPEFGEAAINAWAMHDDVQGKLMENDVELLLRKLPGGRSAWSMRAFADTARDWIRAA
jgi:hypothetical protein